MTPARGWMWPYLHRRIKQVRSRPAGVLPPQMAISFRPAGSLPVALVIGGS